MQQAFCEWGHKGDRRKALRGVNNFNLCKYLCKRVENMQKSTKPPEIVLTRVCAMKRRVEVRENQHNTCYKLLHITFDYIYIHIYNQQLLLKYIYIYMCWQQCCII